MANYTVQLRRGTSAEHSSFTGAAGEITVNTSNNSIHVHDGSTAGGTELATKASVDGLQSDAIQDADNDTHVKVEASADSDTIDFTVGGTTIAKMESTGLIPTVNSNGTTGFDLGSSSFQWRDVYVSSGSLYVNGSKVLQDDAGTILVSADNDQSLTVKTTGTGETSLQSAGGVNLTATGSADITLTTSTGQIEIDGDVIFNAANSITSSNANPITFGSAISSTGTVTGTTFIGNVTGDVTGTVSDISNHSTTDLAEGTNEYYTDAKVDSRITANWLLDEDNMVSNSATKFPSQQSVKAYVDAEVSGIVDAAPGALDTLNELAAALGDDANFSTTVTNSIATKLTKAGDTMSGNLNMGGNDITNVGNITATAVAANSVALGTDTTGNYVQQGATSGNGISGSVNSEGGTFTVTSNATSANTASTIVFRDGSGNFSAGTITATATQAQYADLAERYESGMAIEAGSVVCFGGEHEIKACDEQGCTAVAGVVSTAPAFMMNKDAGSDDTHPYVALAGRVPCKVTGTINKGDLLMASSMAGHAMAGEFKGGAMIGKALENFDGESGVIEVLVNLM